MALRLAMQIDPDLINHGFATNRAEAAQLAIKAGMDVDMISHRYAEELVQLVNEGLVEEEKIDDAVVNMLRIKFELGLFSQPYQSNVERSKAEC